MTAKIERIFPRWARTLGALHYSNALARSQCRQCGVQLRVDVEALGLKHGPLASLIDRSDRCSIVTCHGSVFYLASRSYGRQWLPLLSREDLLRDLAKAAPACNAQSLDLLSGRAGTGRSP